MNKVFNWVFSGFFRTIGRVLVYILLALLLSYILKDTDFSNLFLMKVNAEWYDNIQETPSYASIYNCSSSSCTALSNAHWIDVSFDNNPRGTISAYSTNPNTVSIAQNGVIIGYYLQDRLIVGYIYVIQTYFCTSHSGNASTYLAQLNLGGSSMSQIATTTQTGTTFSDTALVVFTDDVLAGNRCFQASSIVVPNGTKSYAGLRLYRSSGTITTDLTFVGYSIEAIGLFNGVTKSDLQTAITNSGFATASSVQEVQDSVDDLSDQLEEQAQQQHDDHEETIDTLTDDDSSGASGDAGDFFSNFNTNTHGLTGIITAPLSAIQSLTSETCTPLVLPLPFVNQNLTLPCMRTIYLQYFGDFMTLYDTITLGIISYWVLVRIFALVKDFKNPEHDEIEVVDL